MKPENAERVIELLNARTSLEEMQSKISQAQPGTLEYLVIKPGVHLAEENYDLGALTIESLSKIQSFILGQVEEEIEEIDKELEEL